MQSQQYANSIDHKNSTADMPLVEARMFVQAPATRVFEALQDTKLIREWWGPEGLFSPFAEHDFESGGEYLFCMKVVNSSREIWSTGEYLQIVPNKRVVYSTYPANAKGQITSGSITENHEGPFADIGPSFVTVELISVSDHETEILVSHENLPARMHDECVQGWTSSLRKLKRVVERQ